MIVTGFEALGRSNDAQKLIEFVGSVVGTLGPDAVATFNVSELIKRIGNGFAIDMKGLVKTDEEMAKEKQAAQQAAQQEQQAELAGKLGPSAIKEGGKMLENAQQQG